MAKSKTSFGQPGANPSGKGGWSKELREIRKTVAQKLDEAFTEKDGTDSLVSAIVTGVKIGDGQCIKIAAEYRWGKPSQPVELSGGISTYSMDQLMDLLPQALEVLKGGK